MAYYLMIEKKRGIYQPINISNSKYYPRYDRVYNKPCAYSLQEIDEFTMMFNDEIELRERLVEEGTLSFSFFEKPLSIRHPKKEKYIKVPYEPLYQKDLEYIMEPERLIILIMKRYYQNDFLFIKKLASYFSEVHECSTTAPEVARLSEASLYQGKKHPSLDELDRNGDAMVVRMIKLLILKHYEQSDGKIKYKDEVNYRNLHDLIAFINNYDKKKQAEPEKEPATKKIDDIQEKTIAEKKMPSISNPLVKENSKKRTRSKKNYILDGQSSFDI